MNELTLILNTAEKRIQFLLCRGGSLLCAQDWLAQRGGTELLAPAIHEACARLGVLPSDIARIACVAGPGNFTGLRIGIATTSGLARANQARQAGLDYLHCLAMNACPRPGEEVLVMTNARRDLAYCARFRADEEGVPRPLCRTFVMPMPAIPEGTDLGNPDLVLGSAVTSNRAMLGARLPSSLLLSSDFDQPAPAALLAMERLIDWDTRDGADIVPLYLRDCDAVENFTAIAKAQGRTPELAREELQRLMHAGLKD